MSKLYTVEGDLSGHMTCTVYADSEEEAIKLIAERKWFSQDVDESDNWIDPEMLRVTGVEEEDE